MPEYIYNFTKQYLLRFHFQAGIWLISDFCTSIVSSIKEVQKVLTFYDLLSNSNPKCALAQQIVISHCVTGFHRHHPAPGQSPVIGPGLVPHDSGSTAALMGLMVTMICADSCWSWRCVIILDGSLWLYRTLTFCSGVVLMFGSGCVPTLTPTPMLIT